TGDTVRLPAAQDAFGKNSAALDPGSCGRARSRRSHHDRGPGCAGADSKRIEQLTGADEVKTKPCLTPEDCKKIGAACEAEARKNKWNVVIAVLDDGGHLLWLVRMDGATPANAEIAIAKGRSAAVSRRTTKNWEDRIAAGRTALPNMPVQP